MDCSSLSSAFSSIIPPGWDSPAFCSNSYHASRLEGMRVASNFKPALARVIYEWRTSSSCCKKRPPTKFEGSSFFTRFSNLVGGRFLRQEYGISLQKTIFNVLPVPPRDPWPPFINSRMQVFGMDDCALCLDDWEEFLVVLKSCPQSVRTCFLKTIISSGSTLKVYLYHAYLVAEIVRITLNIICGVTPCGLWLPLPVLCRLAFCVCPLQTGCAFRISLPMV